MTETHKGLLEALERIVPAFTESPTKMNLVNLVAEENKSATNPDTRDLIELFGKVLWDRFESCGDVRASIEGARFDIADEL